MQMQLIQHASLKPGSLVIRYPTSIAEDEAVLAEPGVPPREKVAAQLVRIEKGILHGAPSTA